VTTSGSQAQVRRLLSLVPYLMEHDGAKVTDVAEAFGVSPLRLREDLNVLWMCGLPGLAPGDLIEVDMDAVDGEGVIHLSNADYLTRPLRLSADEALALTLALRTLRGLVGTGDREAIDSALTKLGVAAGERASAAAQASVSVTSASEAIQATVSEGLATGRRLDLTYDVASRAETTRRRVDPLRMYVLDGYGYLDAWCWSAGALRSFRLDRVAAVELTDVDVADHPDVVLKDLTHGWFDALADAPLVTVALAPTASWVTEYYPMEQVAPAADGGVTATLRVADPAWFRALLLRLGGAVRVLAPVGAGDEALDAAREALDQYAVLAGPD
jgi:proteasome accessory factor C